MQGYITVIILQHKSLYNNKLQYKLEKLAPFGYIQSENTVVVQVDTKLHLKCLHHPRLQ